MYDALTARYTFACPARGEARVPLSAFRRVERLPGAMHPAVFRITFACACGGEHVGLAAHDELDWAPLGLDTGSFVNVMTARVETPRVQLGRELLDRLVRILGEEVLHHPHVPVVVERNVEVRDRDQVDGEP